MKKISKKAEEMTVKELASYIDYSVLKPEFTEEQIIELTKDGVKLGCATICINPGYIELCTPYVEGTETGLWSGSRIFLSEPALPNPKPHRSRSQPDTIP